MAEIIDSWAQVDGGIRYSVRVGRFQLAVDQSARGRCSAWVTAWIGSAKWGRESNPTLAPSHERRLCTLACGCVRESSEESRHG